MRKLLLSTDQNVGTYITRQVEKNLAALVRNASPEALASAKKQTALLILKMNTLEREKLL